jgi:hypothetical protein
MSKPEHFKIQGNCVWCKHFVFTVCGNRCKKHDFFLIEREHINGFCNDFEKDK